MKKVVLFIVLMAIIFSGCQTAVNGPDSTNDPSSIDTSGETSSSGATTGASDVPSEGSTGSNTGPKASANTAANSDNRTGNYPETTPTITGSGNTTDNASAGSNGGTNGINNPPSNGNTSNPSSSGGSLQTLKYWQNFPERGTVKTLQAYDFKIKNIENGVSISAYNKDGTANKANSITSLSTWLNSYEITDSNGKVLSKGSSKASFKNFNINIRVSGGCDTDKKKLTFRGYHRDSSNSNTVVVYEDSNTSFNITKGSSWTYSSEYSTYPKSLMTVSSLTSGLSVKVAFKKGTVVNVNDFENSYFICTPNSTVNNGLSTLLINVDSYDAYNMLINNSDRNYKDISYSAEYAIVEGTTKTYKVKNQTGTLSIKRRGFSSFTMPKRSFTIELDKKMGLLDMDSNKDWALISNYADKTLLRNYFAYTIGRQMGTMYVPNVRTVDVYLGVNGTSTYMGTYILVERHKVSKTKINITEMTSQDKDINTVNSSDSVSKINAGSFIAEINSFDRFSKNSMGIRPSIDFPGLEIRSPSKSVFQPKEFDPGSSWTWPNPHNATQNTNLANYIKSYFEVVDQLIQRAGDEGASAASRKQNYDKLAQIIDIDSFVDYYIINELAKNVDGNLRLSTYFYKDKGGKLKITIWDFDLAFGNADYGSDDRGQHCGVNTGFYIRPNATWYRRLFRYSEFSSKVKSRWTELRRSGGILSDANITKVINDEYNRISKAATANFNIWPVLNGKPGPNPPAIVALTTHKQNVDHMIQWIKDRSKWLDSNI